MKALSLWRPWDQSILHAGKDFENRPWPLWANMIGMPIALHAGKKYDLDGANWMKDEGLYTPPPPEESPCGIVGVVVFDSVVHQKVKPDSPWFFGPYGWHIKEIAAIGPIPCIGKQGLWNVPKELEGAVERVLVDEWWTKGKILREADK